MPRRSEGHHFAIVCGKAELRRHLRVCEDSEFRVARAADGAVHVYDGAVLLLHAFPIAGGWLVRLCRAYYRHPFGPPSDGTAPPGLP